MYIGRRHFSGHPAPQAGRRRLTLLTLVGALLAGACGSDGVTTESFGGPITDLQPATTTTLAARSDLADSLVASLGGFGAEQLATAEAARCVADGTVASVGEDALVAAGAPDDFQAASLSAGDQEKLVDELLRCVDFTSLLIESVAGVPISQEAVSCLTSDFAASGVVRRAATAMIAGDSADDGLADEIATAVGLAFFNCLSAEDLAAIFTG